MNLQSNPSKTKSAPNTNPTAKMKPTKENMLSPFSILATLVVAAVMAFALAFGAPAMAHGTAGDSPDQTHVQPDASDSVLQAESSDGGGKG